MPVQKSLRSALRWRNTKPNKPPMRLRWLSCVLLSLLVVTSLTGCASSSPQLRENPKQTPIASVIDVSGWQSEVKSYSTELTALLNSAQKITDKGMR